MSSDNTGHPEQRRRVSWLIFFSLISLSFSKTSFAKPPEEKALTLSEAIGEVLANNPDIQAAHFRSQAAHSRIQVEKALEDPSVGVMFDDVPITTSNLKRSEEIDYRVEQKIPFPGKRHVKGKQARFEAEAVSEISSAKIRDVLLDLKKSYYALYRLARTADSLEETRKVLKQYFGSAEIAYAANRVTADVPLKAQVELTRIENDLLMLGQETKTHQAHLKALLNREHHEDIGLPKKMDWPKLKFSLEDIKEMAVHNRPELKELRAMSQRDRSSLTAAKQSLIPDFSFAFQYGQRPTSADTWTSSVMVNLPIFMRKNVARIHEAKANFQATEAEQKSMTIHTQHEIEEAYSAVQTSQELVASFEKGLLPQVQTTLRAAELAYASNKADFMTLLDAVRTDREVESQYYNEQARLGVTFAELERLVGKDLEEIYEKK